MGFPHKIADAGTAVGVLHGGHDALGLVEDHVDEVFVQLDAQAIHMDDSGLGVHADTKLGNHLAVNLYPAFGDHFLADAA